jgi:hypothetical protein
MQQYNFLGHESLQIVWWGATNVFCSWTFVDLYICKDYKALYTCENICLQMLVLCLWGDTFFNILWTNQDKRIFFVMLRNYKILKEYFNKIESFLGK